VWEDKLILEGLVMREVDGVESLGSRSLDGWIDGST
jgi:hypothetical protein